MAKKSEKNKMQKSKNNKSRTNKSKAAAKDKPKSSPKPAVKKVKDPEPVAPKERSNIPTVIKAAGNAIKKHRVEMIANASTPHGDFTKGRIYEVSDKVYQDIKNQCIPYDAKRYEQAAEGMKTGKTFLQRRRS